MNKTSKRILAVGLPLTLVAVTGVGLAYWTSAGTSTGTGSTQSSVANLTVAQVSAPTDLAPGVAPGPVSVDVTNADTTSKVQVDQVVATVSVTKALGAVAGVCDISDYLLGGVEATAAGVTLTDGAAELAPGATATFTTTLGFNNKAVDQNACKGATVTLSYAAS